MSKQGDDDLRDFLRTNPEQDVVWKASGEYIKRILDFDTDCPIFTAEKSAEWFTHLETVGMSAILLNRARQVYTGMMLTAGGKQIISSGMNVGFGDGETKANFLPILTLQAIPAVLFDQGVMLAQKSIAFTRAIYNMQRSLIDLYASLESVDVENIQGLVEAVNDEAALQGVLSRLGAGGMAEELDKVLKTLADLFHVMMFHYPLKDGDSDSVQRATDAANEIVSVMFMVLHDGKVTGRDILLAAIQPGNILEAYRDRFQPPNIQGAGDLDQSVDTEFLDRVNDLSNDLFNQAK